MESCCLVQRVDGRLFEIFRRDGNHDPGLRFVEQATDRGGADVACFQMRFPRRTICFRIETTFGQRNGESAFGAIVRAFYQTCADQFAHSFLHGDFTFEIQSRRQSFFAAVTNLQEIATRRGSDPVPSI